jgi:hypothetical protein
MRKFILVAAMVLVSATAHAGASLASSDAAATAGVEQSRAAQSAGRQRPSMRYQSRQRLQQQQAFAGHRGHGPRLGGLRAKGRSLFARIRYAFHRRRGMY